jgi:diacylglycerol kinase family enzyme
MTDAMADDLTPRTLSATCILNGAAAGVLQVRDKLADLFAQARAEVHIVEANDSSDVSALARKAIAENSRLVLAGGGDGTINAIAAALIGTDSVLGVLPLGTFNHFAKDLNIPLGLEAAVANIFHGEVTRVDVGEVNGRIFLNNSSLGFYPGMVRVREANQLQGHSKWVAFAKAAIFIFKRYSPLTIRTKLDETTTLPASTPFVFVGNNGYQITGLHIGERISLDGGTLWVCQAPHAGRGKLLRLALYALIGRSNPRELVILETSEFWVRPKAKTLHVANDGEVHRMDTPLHYRSLPRALNVIVPPGAKAVVEPRTSGGAKG